MGVAASLSPLRPTEAGMIEGRAASDGTITVFKGIPFAAPPLGERRWQPPALPSKWPGTRRATEFGSSCMQAVRDQSAGGRAFSVESKVTNVTSEDCLYLNVWTPAKAPTDKLPVMVWIYGGGFMVGSGSVPIYDGEGLARRDVVVVSFNYRLGIYGFLALPELDQASAHHSSGNYGLLDQIAALQWVKKNIAQFGGDPARVTIFGQSAGGGSVQFLSLSPLANGLFQGAISENGTLYYNDPFLQERSPIAYKDLRKAEEDDQKYLKGGGVQSLAQLKAMSTAQINELPRAPFPPAFFSPVVDGWVIPAGFEDTYKKHAQANVPFMAGWTSSYYPELKITVAEYQKWARARFGSRAGEFLSLYPATTDEQAAVAIEQSARDSYRISVFLWAKSRRLDGPHKTFTYFFNHPLPGPDAASRGATAGHEIPYVLGSLHKSERPFTTEDHALEDLMTSYWANFARTGNPNGGRAPAWPAFDPTKPLTMQLGDGPGPIAVAGPEKVAFFQQYFDSKPPFCAFGQHCSIGQP
jgi:para-nitrobenzyl esterase